MEVYSWVYNSAIDQQTMFDYARIYIYICIYICIYVYIYIYIYIYRDRLVSGTTQKGSKRNPKRIEKETPTEIAVHVFFSI